MGENGVIVPKEEFEVYIVVKTKTEALELARSMSNLYNHSVNIRPKNPDAEPV